VVRCAIGAPFLGYRTLFRLHFRWGGQECEMYMETIVVDCYMENLEA